MDSQKKSYDKPFLTFSEQISILKTKHNLIIEDNDFAINVLSTLSYYDLINGYKECMQENNIFKKGITIEYLYQFHLFDKNFQSIILKNSTLIENAFKTKFAYILSKNLGNDVCDYLDSTKYITDSSTINFYKVKRKFENAYNGKYVNDPTKHYLKTHNHIPPWIIMRNVSFGNTINLYRVTSPKERDELATMLVPSNKIALYAKIDFIIQSLNLIRIFRNSIAHNLKFVTTKSSTNAISKNSINEITGCELLTNNRPKRMDDVYACILALFILLNNNDLKMRFKNDLSNCILNNTIGSVTNNHAQKKLFKNYSNITKLPYDFLERLKVFEQ